MLDLLPLSEEVKERFISALREVVTELAEHQELYPSAFRIFFTELGKMLTNSKELNSLELENEAVSLMGLVSEYLLNKELRYELSDVDDEEDVELE